LCYHDVIEIAVPPLLFKHNLPVVVAVCFVSQRIAEFISTNASSMTTIRENSGTIQKGSKSCCARSAALVQLDQKEAIRGLRIPWQVLVPSLLTFQ